MKGKLRENARRVYDAAVQEGKDRHERVLWGDSVKQTFRFAEIARFLPNRTASILDVGCGNGEFALFLNSHGHTGPYVGIDINDALLAEAKSYYPSLEFHNADIMAGEYTSQHDHVVASGVFNADFGQDIGYVFSFIEVMFNICTTSAIFNCITTHTSHVDKDAFYVDPALMLDFLLKNVSSCVELRHGIVPYNYTVAVHRPGEWTSLNG